MAQFDHLLDSLTHDDGAAVSWDADAGVLTITAWRGQPLDPPAVIDVDVRAFDRFRLDDDSCKALWPGTSTANAAIYITLVHLEETVLTDGHLGGLRLDENGVSAPARGPGHDGTYE